VHQPSALLEQIAPLVSRLHLTADNVRKSALDDLSRECGSIGSPSAKGGAKPVTGEIVTAHTREKRQHRHIRKRAPDAFTREYEVVLSKQTHPFD
jgi:hypothetical protein